MKKKILAILLFAMMILTLTGCKDNKKENTTLTENVKKLYDMIETYYIPDVYPDFDSYKDSNFYMDNKVKYEDLNEESRLYYAYNTIENIERKWFTSCDELKGYTYENEDIATTCEKSNKEIITKDQSSEEWLFNNVNKETLEKAYHNMYGEDKDIPLKDFTISVTGVCVYSKEKDDYLCFKQTGGDTYPEHGETKFEYYIETKDSLEIYDSYLWIKHEVDNDAYYKSRFNEDEKIDSKTKDFSKGALYKHTFKKDSKGNYYWYSSERVE